MVRQRRYEVTMASGLSSDLKLHDSIVKEVLALKQLRREQVRFAVKVAHKLGPRHLGVAVHTAMLAFHGRHQGQQAICCLPLGFILEQLPQGFRGRVETAMMANLIQIYTRQKCYSHRINARWLVNRARRVRGEQLLQIVRTLDQEMNNTSVILLFQVGKKKLLFPGDAQKENWQYALSQKKYLKALRSVNLYKVGHHGSLNATPKSLWKLFKNKS